MLEDNYELCNCKNVTIKQIKEALYTSKEKNLRVIQELTTAGTECRHCVFEEADFGKIKKKIYCKDILETIKKELING